MVHFKEKARYDYDDLLEIIRVLRSPEGCPWDQVQTHQSIRRGLLEEAYEAAEGIDRDDADLLREELGDVLMQVVFHADIERQRGRFTMEDVVDGVVKKLIFRHPHVFGGAEPEKDAQSVLVSWDAIKRREKHQRTTAQAMDSVARSLPALWRGRKSSRIRRPPTASTGRISRGPCPSWTRRWVSCTRRCRTAPTWPRSWGTCCLPP